jgi:hypothetical protein
MTAAGYAFDQAWTRERTRLAGLEAALADPAVTVVMPLTVAAWGWREGDR